jgi:hypothetical protein
MALAKIQAYTGGPEMPNELRCYGCGIVWLTDRIIATHMGRLVKFTSRSKSSLNAHFLLIGFTVVAKTTAHWSSLLKLFPDLQAENAWPGNWTIRERLPDEPLEPDLISVPTFPHVIDPASPSLPQEELPDYHGL